MTRVALATVTASYSHAPLALYALRAYAKRRAPQTEVVIAAFAGDSPQTDAARRAEDIAAALFRLRADMIGFSCYIWNIEVIARVAGILRQVCPETAIVFGGPEVSAEYEGFLLDRTADAVVPGEGERPFAALCAGLPFEEIAGLAYRTADGALRRNAADAPLEMSELPFPCPEDYLAQTPHKLIYYEAARGCPFACAYCLSSAGGPERRRPLPDVFGHLQKFLDARVPRVKFTDRTFNSRAAYARAVWAFLTEHDNGVTNFHFEIAGDLLDEASLALLAAARPGLFQFEIGVQSCDASVLARIRRRSDLSRLFYAAERVKASGNIHLHLDLIAGLPGEDLASCASSFDRVYAARPDRLQLGFLKLLKGTALRADAEALGIRYDRRPPYEVLASDALSYADLLELKGVCAMVERFHNTGRFTHILELLVSRAASPYALYRRLADFWRGCGYDAAAQGRLRLYDILHAFAQEALPGAAERDFAADALRFDLYAAGNERGLPLCLDAPPPEAAAARLRRLTRADPGRLDRARYVFFRYDVTAWARNPAQAPAKREHILRFAYPEPGRRAESIIRSFD